MTPKVLAPPPCLIAMLVSVVVLTGCQTTKPPSADALGSTALASTPIRQTELLPSCPRDAAGPQRVRSSISSWYEVVRYLEECDLSRIRYYASDRNRDRILGTVVRARQTSQPACSAQLGDVETRFRSAVESIQDWLAISWQYCSLEFRENLLDAQEAKLKQSLDGLSCRIRSSFPEFKGQYGTQC